MATHSSHLKAYVLLLILVVAVLALTGCGEPASTWSEKQGRYRPTDEVRREQINDEIDKREKERGREP